MNQRGPVSTDLGVGPERRWAGRGKCAPRWLLARAAPPPGGPCSLEARRRSYYRGLIRVRNECIPNYANVKKYIKTSYKYKFIFVQTQNKVVLKWVDDIIEVNRLRSFPFFILTARRTSRHILLRLSWAIASIHAILFTLNDLAKPQKTINQYLDESTKNPINLSICWGLCSSPQLMCEMIKKQY